MLGVLGLHGGDGGDEWLRERERERERERGGEEERQKKLYCVDILF